MSAITLIFLACRSAIREASCTCVPCALFKSYQTVGIYPIPPVDLLGGGNQMASNPAVCKVDELLLITSYHLVADTSVVQ